MVMLVKMVLEKMILMTKWQWCVAGIELWWLVVQSQGDGDDSINDDGDVGEDDDTVSKKVKT